MKTRVKPIPATGNTVGLVISALAELGTSESITLSAGDIVAFMATQATDVKARRLLQAFRRATGAERPATRQVGAWIGKYANVQVGPLCLRRRFDTHTKQWRIFVETLPLIEPRGPVVLATRETVKSALRRLTIEFGETVARAVLVEAGKVHAFPDLQREYFDAVLEACVTKAAELRAAIAAGSEPIDIDGIVAEAVSTAQTHFCDQENARREKERTAELARYAGKSKADLVRAQNAENARAVNRSGQFLPSKVPAETLEKRNTTAAPGYVDSSARFYRKLISDNDQKSAAAAAATRSPGLHWSPFDKF